MSMTESQRLGKMGEDMVMARYTQAGFRMVARNLRQYPNEIDLVLESDTHLVFVEVKTRHTVYGVRSRYGRPADAVNNAKKKRILSQFLTEAAVLTSLGGIIGVISGIGLAQLISSTMQIPVAIDVAAITISVVFSMLIGVIFGLLPAIKAANLNPIEALRRN